jgi:hypothetical protein
MPRPFWQRLRVLRVVYVLFRLGSVVPLLTQFTLGPNKLKPDPFMMTYAPFLLVAACMFTLVPRFAFASFRRKLLDNECALCLECGYPLRGLPDEHQCPECGTPYVLGNVRASWTHWLAHRRLPARHPEIP